MKNICYKKSMVLCIIVLFVGVSVLPTISGNKEKGNIVISGIDDGLVGFGVSMKELVTLFKMTQEMVMMEQYMVQVGQLTVY